MKKRFYTLLIALIACVLNGFGQSNLHFEQLEWDFGVIAESDGVVNCRFEGQNRGKEPLVVLSVGVSCGCTTPQFSRKPILPGAPFLLEVQFDPTGRPGPFEKELVLYDSNRQQVRLRVRGEVTPRKRSIEERYPIVAGGGVRLMQNYLSVGNLPQGEEHWIEIGVANTASQPRVLRLIRERGEGFVEVKIPGELQPAEEARLLIRCQVPIESGHYGTLDERFRFEVVGFDPIPFTVRAVAVDAPERVITDEGDPRLEVPRTIRMGERPFAKGVQSVSFRISNEGATPLLLRAVECGAGVGCSLQAGEGLPPRGERIVHATLDPSAFDYGAAIGRILLVTNEPEHPVHQLRVVAIFVD